MSLAVARLMPGQQVGKASVPWTAPTALAAASWDAVPQE